MIKGADRNIEEQYLISKISEYFGISSEDIFSKSRKQEFVEARHHLVYYLYYYSKSCGSPSRVRDVFYKRGGICNHATVLYAVNKIDDNLSISVDANRKILELDAHIGVIKRSYTDIYYFMGINKGDVIILNYKKDKSFLWRHDSIERRGNRTYIVGEIKNDDGSWVESKDEIYEHEGYLCYGWDADRLYVEENES